MAIYNASLLISASNATYFTNVTGGIAAVAVRGFNDTWISSSALLTGSNTFVGNQIISGNVDINGAFSASLQTGYLFVGDGNGRTQAVATSSIITNIATGSFATTGSNTFIGNQIISGNVLPQVDGQGDLGTDTFKWNQVVVNGQLKGSSLNTTGRGAVGTLRVGDETFPLSFLSDREIVGDGTGANTHLYYGTSSSDVTALREIVYTQSGSNADFGNVSASFNTRIDNLSVVTGSFATTGSNVFKGTQFLYSTDGAAPLQISSSAYYGIQLQNQGIQIQGSGGPRIQFPNKAWLNGNENDNFQFTADTDDPLTRGLDFYLYGSGSRAMNFRNASGPGASIQFRNDSGSITFNADNNNMGFNAGGTISITGSQTNINGLRYPQTDGTFGQAIITNGSGILSFGNVSINTGSFMVTGSVAGNVLTFTKGDASTFSLTVDTGSGGGGVTGSFATLGANLFTGSQTIQSGSQIIFNGLIGQSNDNGIVWGASTPYPAKLFYQSGSGGNFLQFQGDAGIDFSVGQPATANSNINFRTQNTAGQIQFTSDSSSISLRAGTNTTISGSSVLLQGLRYPNTDGTNGQVITTNGSGVLTFTTISGGGATGSLLVTASFDNTTRAITFTKGDASTFNLGGFATTGSNTFIGNQTISGSSGGANFSFNAAGTANGQVSIGQTGAGNFQVQQSGSTIIRSNNIGNIDNFWTSSFYNDINVANGLITLTGNPNTKTAASYLLGYSGSLVLGNSVSSPTYAALSHISSSQPNGNGGLIFKNNNNTGTTLLNGGANIFTNPNTPTTDYIRYIGGSNNLFLNNSNGVNVQITASAASVSGNRPTMHNNIFNGTSNFNINLPAVNPGSHNYNNNIFNAGALTINGMGFTGSLTLGSNINAFGSITVNPASASFAEIASGLSGSHNITVNANGIFGGSITLTTNRNQPANISYNVSNNVSAGGSIIVTNHSSSLAVNAQSNFANGTMQYTNVGAAGLGVIHRSAGNMNANYGNLLLIASASAITSTGNICTSALAFTNQMWSSSIGSGSSAFNNNLVQGAQNTYLVTGSYGGTAVAGGNSFSNNAIFGSANTFFTNVTGRGNYTNFVGNGIFGSQLILTGSNNTALFEQGGAHIGRWNANDGIRNQTGETIFSVGTGVSGSRKTGFLIDSGSNTFVEGTFNVSGSTTITGSLILSSSAAIELQVIGNTEMTGSLLVSSFTTLASVSSSLNFADDTAAAAGGVPLGGLYRNGNFVMIRLT